MVPLSDLLYACLQLEMKIMTATNIIIHIMIQLMILILVDILMLIIIMT